MASRESNRVKDADRKRVLDDASRNRRARKALEALEQDNFHDDPHADLVMSKKLPKFHDSLDPAGGSSAAKSSRPGGGGAGDRKSGARRGKNADFIKAKYRKTLAQLLEEDKMGERWGAGAGSGRYAAGLLAAAQSAAQEDGGDGGDGGRAAAAAVVAPRGAYSLAQVPPSRRPQRHFCAVCGFQSAYTCTSCGTRYCSIRCLGTHRDTRCLKWTA